LRKYHRSGLPSTGVFVRTSVNFTNGANHPLSQLMNAVLVLVVTAVAMPLFKLLPMASVAAVLVLSAVRMVPFKYIVGLWKQDRAHFILCVATAILCTILDMIVGLIAGTFLAFLVNAMRSCQCNSAVVARKTPIADGVRSIMLNGPYCYSNAENANRRVIEELCKNTEYGIVPKAWVIELTLVNDVDLDGVDALNKLRKALLKKAPDFNVEKVLILDEKYDDHYGEDSKAVHGASSAELFQLSNAEWFKKLCVAEEEDKDFKPTVFKSEKDLAEFVHTGRV
jgi:MFS superfamily sulfate permease-like transporter